MIDSADAQNLLALLERVNLAAREVDIYVSVRTKLRAIAAPLSPAVPEPISDEKEA